MSNRDARGPLVNKLREGLQETVVFLRTLGSYKIPAVIERRRKELLDKLCLLQGDTIKEAPPIIDPPEENSSPQREKVSKDKAPLSNEKAATKDKVTLREHSSSVSDRGESPDSVTSPSHGGKLNKRDSKISNLIKDYESIHYTAKKEEEEETPKRLVTLKRVAKPVDYRRNSTPEPPKEEELDDTEKPPKEEQKEEEKKGEKKNKGKSEAKDDVTDSSGPMAMLEVEGSRERRSSVTSTDDVLEEGDGEESEKSGDKKKKKSKLPFGFKKKRDKSPAPERKHPPAEPAVEAEPEPLKDNEEEEEVQLADGVKIVGVLERNKKKGLGHKKIKIDAQVFHTKLILGGKEELDLANCSLEETESGFDLTHPQHRSVMVFKVDGLEDEKQKWVSVMKETIAEATPIKEEPEAPEETVTSPEVPSITINEVPTTKSNKRESKVVNTAKKLPEQGVTLKGYFHRKKPGLGRSWEKTYCVLTYQAFYFTNMEDNEDYSATLPIYPNMEATLSETRKGKGHDKHSQVPGLSLKMGKKVEQLSFDSQADFRSWKDAIECVLGIGGVEELLSEDEEKDGAIEEDLYEELETDFIPPVPESPRPARPNIPAPVPDDIIIDEDIYEETDDILPEFTSSSYKQSPSFPDRSTPSSAPALPDRNAPSSAPSLPERNPPKKATSPPPSLPPRSGPVPGSPRRPPKSGVPSPQEYEATQPPKIGLKPAAKPPPPTVSSPADEELYDDVLVGNTGADEAEEMYDDVVVTENGGIVDEELYDDVLAVTAGAEEEPIMEENYEDMAPGTPDPYVTMEKKAEEEAEDEELYVDVEEPATIKKPPPPKQVTKQTPKSGGTFSRMFQKKSVAGSKAGLSGAVAYKAPKKSKFEDKWVVIEGSLLLIYKNSSDKRSQDKIPLGECKLEHGSTEAGAGKFAFRLGKGEKMHHFSFKEKKILDDWLGIVKGLVKYAPVETPQGGRAGEDEVYEAKEDHIAETDEEITFKKGTLIRLITRESSSVWVGQIGTENQVFEGGKIGKFPANKVQFAEDLYI